RLRLTIPSQGGVSVPPPTGPAAPSGPGPQPSDSHPSIDPSSYTLPLPGVPQPQTYAPPSTKEHPEPEPPALPQPPAQAPRPGPGNVAIDEFNRVKNRVNELESHIPDQVRQAAGDAALKAVKDLAPKVAPHAAAVVATHPELLAFLLP